MTTNDDLCQDTIATEKSGAFTQRRRDNLDVITSQTVNLTSTPNEDQKQVNENNNKNRHSIDSISYGRGSVLINTVAIHSLV